jgi:hypothetical protein
MKIEADYREKVIQNEEMRNKKEKLSHDKVGCLEMSIHLRLN